jgi:cysteine desulfurase
LKPLYLDHNATTPIAPEVIHEMTEAAEHLWANPSSSHPLGHAARAELEKRRAFIGRFIGAKPSEIVFTAGGTEADNLALFGAAGAHEGKGGHIIVSSVEHHAVLESCEALHQRGFRISYLPVDQYGRVNPKDVEREIGSDTILVSIMHANNEVGTIEPIAEIGTIVKEQRVLFHTDAAQSLGKIPVQVDEMRADLLTCSSHKIYGPKGIGFLYVREGTRLSPQLVGGKQERGVRSGTENLPGICGLAKALELAGERMISDGKTHTGLRNKLYAGLTKSLEGVHLNGHPRDRLPGTLNVSIEGIKSSELIEALNQKGICLSASAACTSESIEPSHVLSAMAVPLRLAAGTLRVSLGRSNTEDEISLVTDAIVSAVKKLRKGV